MDNKKKGKKRREIKGRKKRKVKETEMDLGQKGKYSEKI